MHRMLFHKPDRTDHIHITKPTVFLDLSKSSSTTNLKSGCSFRMSWFFVLLSMIQPKEIAT